MSSVLTQQSLFAAAGNVPEPKDVWEPLPILYQGNISYSLLSTLDKCPRMYFYLYPGTWWGWDPVAPSGTQEAYWHKKLQGWQGWAGHIVHETAEHMLWNDIDQALAGVTGIALQTDEEIRERVRVRFEGEWRQSRGWTEETFRKQSRRTKPVWLAEHKTGKWPSVLAGDRDPINLRAMNQCRRWIDRSVKSLLQRRSSYHNEASWDNFLIIEGKRVHRGLIVQPDNEPIQSQAMLRNADTYPGVSLIVDGEQWKFAMKIDLMVYTPQGKYLIIDFKTGQRKYRRSHLKQLQLYAAFMLRESDQFASFGLPPITEDNLVLRVVYTDPAESREKCSWEQYEVRRGDAGRFLYQAQKMVRRLRRYHVRLDELDEIERQELKRMLPARLFSGPEGLFEADGKMINASIEPALLACVPSLTPPVQAQKGNVRMCTYCSCLDSCRTGKDLVEIAKKK